MLLNDLSYYKTGTTCDELIMPTSVPELAEAIKELANGAKPYYLLGAGSNSLIMDEHWSGTVISFAKLNILKTEHTQLIAEAGIENSKIAELSSQRSLSGAEWMYYLPGQIGATVRMNARCYGGEISELVEAVTVVKRNGDIKEYSSREVFLGYKSTSIMEKNEIVASVRMSLQPGNPDDILDKMMFCKTDRENKHQFDYPSCGCVFKNDYKVGVPSGYLLDHANVRKLNSSNVEISPYHANFVFNKGATSREILETTFKMREAVFKEFGVWLEYEMEVLGVIPGDLNEMLLETRRQNYHKSRIEELKKQFQSTQ